VVVGQAMRALREGARPDTARRGQYMLAPPGLDWTRAQVAGIEPGRGDTFATDKLLTFPTQMA